MKIVIVEDNKKIRDELCEFLSKYHYETYAIVDFEHAVEDILAFESGLFDYIKTQYPEIPESIKNDKVLKEEVEEALRKAIGEYKEQFQAR